IAHSIKNIEVLIESIANAKAISADDKTRATAESDSELKNLRALASARALYFHHLQGISDAVISIDSKNPYNDISKCLGEEVILKAEIAKLTSKLNHLEHIEDTIAGSIDSEEKANGEADTVDRLCLTCSDQYHYGLLTECGHTFCKSCLLEWTKGHSKCPSCKGHISKNHLKPFSMAFSSMLSMSAPADRVYSQNMDKTSLEDFHTALSSDLMQPVPERIQLVKIQGGYVSKIEVPHPGRPFGQVPDLCALLSSVEIPCFELFEQNSASGSSKIGLSESKRNVIANEKSTTVTSKIAETNVIGISDDSEDIEAHQVSLLDSDMVTTVIESAESQRNNGERVKEADLRYCFASQKKMIQFLAAMNIEKSQTSAISKGKEIALADIRTREVAQ
ncbi:hypothetical protein BGX21_005880, partial [Mortierella sp. AD011]